VRRAPLPHLCALLAGATAALAVGCGDRSHLVPVDDAQTLKDRLAAVQQAVDAGNCDQAEQALNRASDAAQNLDANEVDRRLRRRILDGIQQLRETVRPDCEDAQTETVDTTTTETVTTDTVPTETTETTETVQPTTTVTTPDTTTTPTTTTPTTTTSQPQTTPDGTSPETGGTEGDEVTP
jgi:hypothetical protein